MSNSLFSVVGHVATPPDLEVYVCSFFPSLSLPPPHIRSSCSLPPSSSILPIWFLISSPCFGFLLLVLHCYWVVVHLLCVILIVFVKIGAGACCTPGSPSVAVQLASSCVCADSACVLLLLWIPPIVVCLVRGVWVGVLLGAALGLYPLGPVVLVWVHRCFLFCHWYLFQLCFPYFGPIRAMLCFIAPTCPMPHSTAFWWFLLSIFCLTFSSGPVSIAGLVVLTIWYLTTHPKCIIFWFYLGFGWVPSCPNFCSWLISCA